MRIRVHTDNINSKTYFDKYYSNPDWWKGMDGEKVRLKDEIAFIKREYPKHLDVGCADGIFTQYYLQKYPETKGWGVDISEVICEIASRNCPEGVFQAADVYHLPFPDETFDLVHAAEIIEHLESPEKAITECCRVLKKGGDFIMTVPNENASDYVEHLWRWDVNGVREIILSTLREGDIEKLGAFTITSSIPAFHNGHVMLIQAQKI